MVGRTKPDLTRKLSASSSKSGLISPPSPCNQDDTSESDSLHRSMPSRPRQTASAPSSAKSRSSESSGYQSHSRSDKIKKEPRSSSTTPSSSSRPTSSHPLRRLAHTNSSSSMKAQSQSSNRSSSSLTSKEAEFQAWKRRKNYDPIKSASRHGSSGKERKVSSSRSYSKSPAEQIKESPRHKRLQDISSREMTKSLIMEDLESDTPMQRSNSFHCNGKVR